MTEKTYLGCACKPSVELAAYLFWKLQARLLKQQNRLLKLHRHLIQRGNESNEPVL